MHIALADLQLDHLYVMYPGKDVFPLYEKITACGLDALGHAKTDSQLPNFPFLLK